MNTDATDLTFLGAFKSLMTKACSGTLMSSLDSAFEEPLEAEEKASMFLAGGLMRGYQCGMLWGSTLAAGAQAHRLFGPGPRAEEAALRSAARLVEVFLEQNQETNCRGLTKTDFLKRGGTLVYMAKGGPISCTRMAQRFAPIALGEINEALVGTPESGSERCASCASEVARRLGASERHSTMAAGFGGGIGLSGGGCGALGAAIWIASMRNPDDRIDPSLEGTKVGEVLDAFLEVSRGAFECSEIVGRPFEDVDDHARHLRSGGCLVLIDALVAASTGEERSRAA